MTKILIPVFFALIGSVCAQTLEEARAVGALKSSYRKQVPRTEIDEAPEANLDAFRKDIEPLLRETCVRCHGPEKQKADFRVDTLDPDLIHGGDADWWLEVIGVLSNGEMPPEDEDELAAADRSRIIDWLSTELQVASQVARSEQGHSSFRRMTRYEYNYALQDLLGLPYDFARDLPPETASEDGFLNSSEMLQMSATQFQTYRTLGRQALRKAAAPGERPETIYYGIAMEAAAARVWKGHDAAMEKIRRRFKDDPEKIQKEIAKQEARFSVKPSGTHYTDLTTGRSARATWSYGGARHAWAPTTNRPDIPPVSSYVAIIPARQKLILDLGDSLPDTGLLRVRIRASGVSEEKERIPYLRVFFGHQASNNSQATERVGDTDIAITAVPKEPEFYQFDIPLGEVVRNPYRGIQKLGQTPNPAEYVMLENSSIAPVDIQFDYVEFTAPAYEQWPPESHTRIFVASSKQADDAVYAREILTQFMSRAWRRSVTDAEIDQKVALFEKLRPGCGDFQEAMIEVLAGVISSPKFLYLVQSESSPDLAEFEVATRLSMFLWSSLPDQQLLDLAATGKLDDPDVLIKQTERMLADPRAQRFSKHFVRQWLGMQLLDFLQVDKETYGQFDDELKAAMQEEPIAFFREVLQEDHSVIDFLHADYAMVNERLARHYGLPAVHGAHFRRTPLKTEHQRGGLLTQAGLLAMNSDGKDSHPLKRGIWLLESLLHDPPPPPPPAVPEIDLTDPDILKLTLKERMEDHRSDPACISCHAKIDPWGIAFENFDAVGSWRTTINRKPVDASSVLFNNQELHGMDGLKRFLLANRQDQFARAMVHKLTSYALGRPLSFADRSGVDQITADLRQQGDGLATLINLIVTSDLFQSK